MQDHVINGGNVYLRYQPNLHAVLPHAEILDMAQGRVMAVPYQDDEVQVLNNMGIKVAPLFDTEYDWRGNKPFETQRKTSSFITQHPRVFVTSSMGVGKTAALLFAFDYLKKRGKATRLLIAAPKSTLNPTWRREILLRVPHLSLQVLRGPTKQQRLDALAIPSDIYVINHDGVKVVLDELIKRLDIDMFVIDELTTCKNARSERSKAMQKLSATRRRVVGMTGTPVSNDIMDAYGQMKVVLGQKFRMTFSALRETLCFRSGPYKWLPRQDAVETLSRMYQPNIRFTRDDTYDLPPCTTVTRECDLTPEQTKLLKELRDQGAAMVAQGTIKGANEAALLSKMMQVVLGGVYSVDGKIIKIDSSPRTAELMSILDELDGRALIFAPFKETVRQLAELLGSKYRIGVITGDVKDTDRDEVFSKFQSGMLDYIVAHPRTMSHGLTLTEASTVIWYGPPDSLETCDQANARITRAGQKSAQLIVHMVASPLERRVFSRLERKAALQDVLLDILKDLE